MQHDQIESDSCGKAESDTEQIPEHRVNRSATCR